MERQKIPSRVVDLSEEGAAFFTRYPATTNQSFHFAINLAAGGKIEGQADVRWVKQKESANGYAIGCRFSPIDDANVRRIQSFLEELDATLGLGAGTLD
ncbi:MAG: PilZ domain-containing protein [Candidatus Hydrogenedentota bacterium]